ncbi:hypothetical protein [Alteribacillus iranensis]|uniref:Uncharacterized protein n=1 Tax=Alteribacillus iranensis TaxID=930128 RepID=A0A1I1ZHB5_9BACI|nr:hypothetical protein [Alteribacillus iranensis]SFE29953.1 hypothetical protein SAMN05192532_101191 [Alteribacillus iranensis]
MIESLADLLVAGTILGASISYSRNQSTLSFIVVLLFLFCSYVGYLLSSNGWVYVETHYWFIDSLRVIAALGLVLSGWVCFMPLHGFYHQRSRYIWMATSFFSFFIGWHAGHWLKSMPALLTSFCLFILFLVAGRIAWTAIATNWKQRSYTPHAPYGALLLFSILLLL